ncbi:MAG: TauD/TfdA family dioxygenase [Proteobacteria bacterium]|nr:TauD/TfdA family dioxygenase [Pseudomonadota bacterium]
MALEFRKVSHALGAEVIGADLSQPLDDATFAQIRAAFTEHCLLLFREQDLTREAFIAFSRRFGELDLNEARPADTKVAGIPELMLVVGKPKPDGAPATGTYFGAGWHTDNSHLPIAAAATLLRAIDLPEVGGDTMFCNMYRAYDSFSDGMKKLLEPLYGVHMLTRAVYDTSTPEAAAESFRKYPAAAHPAVRVHPESGRKALYVNTQVRLIEGMTAAESKPLLNFLSEHAVNPHNVYHHKWRKNDLIMWDNRCLLHMALANYDRTQVRSMERATVHGVASGHDYQGPVD